MKIYALPFNALMPECSAFLCASVVNMHLVLHVRRLSPLHPLRSHPNDIAVALAEPAAALAPIQRPAPSHPPT